MTRTHLAFAAGCTSMLLAPVFLLPRPGDGGLVGETMRSQRITQGIQGHSPSPSRIAGLTAVCAVSMASFVAVQALRKRSIADRKALRMSVACQAASEAQEAALSRRGASLLALTPMMPAAANAEESIRGVPASIQRVVVDVGNNEGMEKELKFWTKACQMQVLSDGTGADGLRSVTVGYGPESADNSFAVEIKVDPSALTRKRPSLLNYSAMQPTVNALNFTQISQPDQIFDMYARVEDSGGTSLVGDARYLDCESPRGVQVRMVPREGPATVELVSLNIEVPAFDATKKFYQRVGSLEETAYNEAEEAPIQKYSVLLKSRVGGPKLLLCPVPDQRIKQRDRDEFVGIVMLAPSAQQAAETAEKAIVLALEEDKKKEEDEREKLLLAGKNPEDIRRGTVSRPAVEMAGSDARMNDGVGNMLTFVDKGTFKSSLRSA